MSPSKRKVFQIGLRLSRSNYKTLKLAAALDGFSNRNFQNWIRFVLNDYARSITESKRGTFRIAKTNAKPPKNCVGFGVERIKYRACPHSH